MSCDGSLQSLYTIPDADPVGSDWLLSHLVQLVHTGNEERMAMPLVRLMCRIFPIQMDPWQRLLSISSAKNNSVA